jgi:DNA-binding transcriptional LysR family regulator
LQQAREAIGQLDYAAKTAGSAGRGAVGRLSIGILSSMAAGFLRELIKGYSELHPDVAIQILEGASVEHVTAVRKRQLDVAFILDTTEAAGCELAPLWNERIFVVLPEHHSLRRRKQIEWQDLSNERLIVRQSERDPALCDRLTRRLTDGDQTPRVEKLDVGRETLMHLVSLGRGVGFTSESTVATPFPKVVFRPVAGDNELLQFCAAWSPDNDNPALRRFLSLARTMAKEKRQGPGNGSGPVSSRSTVATGVTLLLAFLGALARRLGLLT